MSPPATDLSGILVALITPFTASQTEIDFHALDQHIDRLISHGIHGLVPGGSTGEFTVLSIPERKALLEACLKSASGRVPIIAGIGDTSQSHAVELATHAGSVGAAATMVVPPFYDALSYPELLEFLGEIYKASGGLPIVYYNIPSASGMRLSCEQIAGLAKVGVKYMKDTSGDAPALTEMLFHRHGQITTFNGWDTLTFYGLAAGAKGSVWGAANVIPELCMQLWTAVAVENNIEKGRDLWAKIWPVCAFLEEGNYAASVKTGMELREWKTGGMRKPFNMLKSEERTRLAALMRNAGVEVIE